MDRETRSKEVKQVDLFSILAEERIKEAMKNKEFDNLPGKGKPLPKDDLAHVPSELRIGYKILKNAGMIPEEMQIKKEMLEIEDLIACCYDEEEKEQLKRKLNEKLIRFNLLMEKRKMGQTGAFKRYQSKLNRLF